MKVAGDPDARTVRPGEAVTYHEMAPRRVSVSHDTAASILSNPDGASLKRLAWAYGCAKKGSEEERLLRVILIDRIQLRGDVA